MRARAFRASSSDDQVGILAAVGADDEGCFVQRYVLHAAAALQIMATGVLHQDAAHDLGRDREEVGAVLPLHAFVVHQTHVRLVDQSGGLEAVAGALAFHVPVGEAMEFLVDDRCETGRGRPDRLRSRRGGAYLRCCRHLHSSSGNYTAPIRMIPPWHSLRLLQVEV